MPRLSRIGLRSNLIFNIAFLGVSGDEKAEGNGANSQQKGFGYGSFFIVARQHDNNYIVFVSSDI
jgi:hypothetical protein